MIEARDYQIEAVQSIYNYFGKHNGNPVIAMPTGTGKSVVIAMFCESVFKQFPNQKIMCVTHVKELILQNYTKLMSYWPFAPAGIYSSGLKQRDTRSQIIFAGIQSVAKRWAEFGKIDLLIIDEAHLLSPEDNTNYQKFIAGLKSINPALKVIGLTATPYRLGHGHIADGTIFDHVCFDITNMEAFNRLIAEGHLSPLIPKRTQTELDIANVKLRGGEYNSTELQLAVDKKEVTHAALKEALRIAYDREHWLIFSSGVEHAEHIAEMMQSFGQTCLAVHSKMSSEQRDDAIKKFQLGEVRALVNNNILTTGFDSPWIDCIVCLRPTTSSVLWVQMLGRGTRPYPGKTNCLALDFAGNTRKLGPINDPVVPRKKGEGGGDAPVKCCEVCDSYNHASARVCNVCGAEFPIAVKIQVEASTTDLIKGDLPKVVSFKVDQITYREHHKAGRPPSLKVSYYCGLRVFNEFILVEYPGFGGRKAKQWWNARTENPMPSTTAEALNQVDQIPAATHIKVWMNSDSGHPEVLQCCFDGTNFQTQAPATDLPEIIAEKNAIKPRSLQSNLDADIPF